MVENATVDKSENNTNV